MVETSYSGTENVHTLHVPTPTLSKISNWSPYIFTLVLKVRFGYSNFILL